MKKRSMGYGQRLAVVIAAAAITAAGVFSLVFLGLLGFPQEKKVPAATYACLSEISCSPVLKAGTYYQAGNVEFGSIYIASFVDKLNLNCRYSFTGSADDVSGSYEIKAVLAGTLNNQIIWKKEYLLDSRDFTGPAVEKPLVLELETYRTFVSEIQTETNVKPDVTMTIFFDVGASASAGGQLVSETSSSTLQFSLSDPLLAFTGAPSNRIDRTIERAVTTHFKLSSTQLFANIAVLALSVFTLVYTLFFTFGRRRDPAERQLEKICKSYGGRIVEIRTDAGIKAGNVISVNSFKDLMLTADELKKPILRIGGDDYRRTRFIVVDEPWQYVFHAISLANQPKEPAAKNGRKQRSEELLKAAGHSSK